LRSTEFHQISRFFPGAFPALISAAMRAFLIALLFLTATSRAADDDLFTGVPPETVPVDVRSFLAYLSNAMNSGEPNSVLSYAITPEVSGVGMYFLRQRLTGLSKERKVKKIEMLPSVADADVEDTRSGVKYRPAAKPTHTVVARLEGAPGDIALIELPVAKVTNPITNKEIWRIMAPGAAIPAGESPRLAEAKFLAESRPDVPQYQVEVATLHALLGQRKEVEILEARLLALADGKAINQASYIHTQLGWIRYHLGDAKQALESFKKGFDLGAGKGVTPELGLAVGYYATGDFADAVRHYDHAAGQAPLYSDREALEKMLKDSPTMRPGLTAVQALWLRAFAPNPIPQP
jgi:tetratricopeptide (TPR) repeat protein